MEHNKDGNMRNGSSNEGYEKSRKEIRICSDSMSGIIMIKEGRKEGDLASL